MRLCGTSESSVCTLLVDKKIVSSTICLLCLKLDETPLHALWTCKSLCLVRKESSQFELLAIIWWRVWFRRNKLVQWCKNFLVKFQASKFSNVKPHSVAVLRGHTWRPPDISMYKINCDTAICANGNCVRIEVIIRDSSRDVMLSALKTIVAGLSPSIVEASTIHAGIKLAVETGLLPVIVESDSLSVVNLLLARQPICSEICLVINDILELKTLYGFSSFVISDNL
ncbi:hypothetical protein ACOSQ2_009670 [Xanthoceras sorbifolium]